MEILFRDLLYPSYCPLILFFPFPQYERSAIEKWFRRHDKSPLTGLTVADKTLAPNIVLNGMLVAYKEGALRKRAANHKGGSSGSSDQSDKSSNKSSSSASAPAAREQQKQQGFSYVEQQRYLRHQARNETLKPTIDENGEEVYDV